jgi:hypothetical protein
VVWALELPNPIVARTDTLEIEKVIALASIRDHGGILLRLPCELQAVDQRK